METEHWGTDWHAFHEDYDTCSDRGLEIKQWIDHHSDQFNNFCILDDMADMRPLQDSLVKCYVYEGMCWKQYHEAKGMLMAGYSV